MLSDYLSCQDGLGWREHGDESPENTAERCTKWSILYRGCLRRATLATSQAKLLRSAHRKHIYSTGIKRIRSWQTDVSQMVHDSLLDRVQSIFTGTFILQY